MSSLSGILLVDKPNGLTSHDVVDRVRKLLKTREVGHTGTLDPMATGLLVILIGQATKLSPYIMDGDKAYSVEVQLGLKTDTLDVTGKTLVEKPVESSVKNQLQKVLQQFSGEFDWPVPIFSAVKVKGQKLYEVARASEEVKVEIPVKKMKFWNIHELQPSGDKSFWVHLECSKGSFVRTWVDQLGESLGCGAAMKSLRRTSSKPFDVSKALTLEQLEKLSSESMQSQLMDMSSGLQHMKKVRVQSFDQTLLLNGQLSHDLRRLLIGVVNSSEACLIQVVSSRDQKLLAIVGFEPGVGFKIKRVFNNS